MPSSTALAGYIGYPTEVHVPKRSRKRIQNAIFDAEQRHATIDRRIEFQAIETQAGDNISQVTVESRHIDGRRIGEIVRIVYRNGRFRKATIEHDGKAAAEITLGLALTHLRIPAGTYED